MSDLLPLIEQLEEAVMNRQMNQVNFYIMACKTDKDFCNEARNSLRTAVYEAGTTGGYQKKYIEIATRLMKAGVPCTDDTDDPAGYYDSFAIALRYRNIELIKLMLKHSVGISLYLNTNDIWLRHVQPTKYSYLYSADYVFSVLNLILKRVSSLAKSASLASLANNVAENADIRTLRLLVLKGLDINTRLGTNGSSLLISACAGGQYHLYRVVQFLIKNGANVHTRTTRGKTALHYATSRDTTWHTCSYVAVQELIKAGANINAQDSLGRTPLMNCVLWECSTHYIAKRNERLMQRKIALVLINAGAKLTLKDKEGYTCMDYAKNHCAKTKLYQILLDKGVVTNEEETEKTSVENTKELCRA